MKIEDALEVQGHWLFRWRSYLPLFFLGLAMLALGEATYPFGSHWLDQAWELICFMIGASGIAIRAYAVGCTPRGTSGRNTRKQVAETLNTTGLYSIVRHPLYLGNFLMWLGCALFVRQWIVMVMMTVIFALYHERIILAEERFLERQFGDVFHRWAATTPAFLPRMKLWRPPALPFSLRHALRREYLGLCGLATSFFVLELVQERVVEGRWQLDPLWMGIWVATLGFTVIVRIAGKYLGLLNVEGR